MDSKPALYVVFTMDCEPVASKAVRSGPKSWEQSVRSIEGFSYRLLTAGYAPTLFVSPRTADEHAPLFEELVDNGVELGAHIHPPQLSPDLKRHLGVYREHDQRTIIGDAARRIESATGIIPRSFRSGMYSASDDTYRIAFEQGFRQGSVSQPGREVKGDAAVWTGKHADPHYVHPEDRLVEGGMPFLEVPVTADAQSTYRRGVPYDLSLDQGFWDEWHQPLIEAQLRRMETEGVRFRSLCIPTRNLFGYHLDDTVQTTTLTALVGYFDTLREQYNVVPTTLEGAHAHYRKHSLVSSDDVMHHEP